jgi:DNA invertase Pin-like site-specific DNA recombinase
MRKKFRAALYLRVSTDQQTVENQRIALEAVAQQRAGRLSGSTMITGSAGRRSVLHARHSVAFCRTLRAGRSISSRSGH